jgi:hypothetical protein
MKASFRKHGVELTHGAYLNADERYRRALHIERDRVMENGKLDRAEREKAHAASTDIRIEARDGGRIQMGDVSVQAATTGAHVTAASPQGAGLKRLLGWVLAGLRWIFGSP